MAENILKVSKLVDYAELPVKSDDLVVGYDVKICRANYKFADKKVILFDTGIAIEPPDGFYVEVVPRSIISNTNFVMTNSVGIIDPKYKGPILLPLRYVGKKDLKKEAEALVGKKIAQLVIHKIYEFEILEIESDLMKMI